MEEIRELTTEERSYFTSAVVVAVDALPAFKDGVGLLRPYWNSSSPFAQIDEHSRVGLGPLFFKATPKQRATVLLHEVLHVFSNHFSRGARTGVVNQEVLNLSADFEINSQLSKNRKLDISFGVMPEDYNLGSNLLMESYVKSLSESGMFDKDSKGGESEKGEAFENSQNNEGSGGSPQDPEGTNSEEAASGKSLVENNENESSKAQATGGTPGLSEGDLKNLQEASCGMADDELSAAVDAAGIERASESEKSIAKKNTRVRLQEMKRKSAQAGKSHQDSLLDLVLEQMEPPKVRWQSLLTSSIGRTRSQIIAGTADYSSRRVNRRLSTVTKFIFPGMVSYPMRAMIGIDTSGSMGDEDFISSLSEVDEILRKFFNKETVKFFSVDTKVSATTAVKSVKDLDLFGGGGTDMTAAWEYVLSLPRTERPDMFILFTDGGFSNWGEIAEIADRAKREKIKSIVLVTNEKMFMNVPKEVCRDLQILDISPLENSRTF